MPYFDALTFTIITSERLMRTRAPSSWALVLWQLASIPLVHAAMGLERVLRPEIAHTPIEEPLFVVGNFRAGTTLLLRLLAADPCNACFTTYELGVPAPTLRRLLPDAVRRWAARSLIQYLEPLDDIHPIRLDEPEEDELLFLHLGNCAHYELMLPLGKAAERRVRRFWEWPRRKRDRFGAFHRACVQRLLWDRGAERYISKSPHFGGRIDDLRRWYPGVRFVYLVRSPLEGIPSALSMAAALWRSGNIDWRAERAAMASLYQSLVGLYRRTDDEVARLPADVIKIVRYPDLVADPARTLAGIYRWLDRSFDDRSQARVEVELARAAAWRSRHVYSLESFGLDAETVCRDLSFLFDKYGFAKPADLPEHLQRHAC